MHRSQHCHEVSIFDKFFGLHSTIVGGAGGPFLKMALLFEHRVCVQVIIVHMPHRVRPDPTIFVRVIGDFIFLINARLVTGLPQLHPIRYQNVVDNLCWHRCLDESDQI